MKYLEKTIQEQAIEIAQLKIDKNYYIEELIQANQRIKELEEEISHGVQDSEQALETKSN